MNTKEIITLRVTCCSCDVGDTGWKQCIQSLRHNRELLFQPAPVTIADPVLPQYLLPPEGTDKIINEDSELLLIHCDDGDWYFVKLS